MLRLISFPSTPGRRCEEPGCRRMASRFCLACRVPLCRAHLEAATYHAGEIPCIGVYCVRCAQERQ